MEEVRPVKKFSLKKMRDTLVRAQTEKANYYGGYCEPDTNDLPKGTEIKEPHGTAIITSQNGKDKQEDRAGFVRCSKDFEKPFLAYSLEEKAEFLNNHILQLARETQHLESGTTLTVSLLWTTRDKKTKELTSHVLTAHMGDSVALICSDEQTDESLVRLTCDHAITEKNERAALIEEGFEVKQKNISHWAHEVYLDGKLVAQQIGLEYLQPHPVPEAYEYLKLQMTRSLGDREFHHSSPVFRCHPDITYHSVPTKSNPCLISMTDGVATKISERNLRTLRESANKNTTEFAKKAVCFARKKRSTDNLGIVVTNTNEIPVGIIAVQFVADGHGGSETVDYVAQNIAKFAPISSKKFTLAQMQQQVERAEAERKEDIARPVRNALTLPYTGNLGAELPHKTTTKKGRSIVVSSLNGRPYQEDRADFRICDSEFAKQFHECDIEQKAALLNDKIEQLSEETAHMTSGTTLTASLMWTTQDESTGKLISHVLTAHIGDSRAIKCTVDQATRLTRHHSLLRTHERNALESESKEFKVEKVVPHEEYFDPSFSETVMYLVIQDGRIIAQQTSEYLRAGVYGLAMSRSLGDTNHHASSPAFRSYVDCSYRETPMELDPYVVTCSDGVTDFVSDENIRTIISEANGECEGAALNAVRLSHQRGSTDNQSIIITRQKNITLNEVAFQFVADGHGGSETAEYVAKTLRRFPYMGLGKELKWLIDEILVVHKHETNEGEKYELLRNLGQKIQNQDFKDVSEVEAAAKNFFYLALQRNYIGLVNTTDSGLKIQELLNKEPEYIILRNMVSEKEGNIQYRDIRGFVTGFKDPKDKRNNERLFSGLNRKEACKFWRDVVKTENGVSINNIPAVINKVRPVK